MGQIILNQVQQKEAGIPAHGRDANHSSPYSVTLQVLWVSIPRTARGSAEPCAGSVDRSAEATDSTRYILW